MADERSIFERLDSIEATGKENNRMVAELLGILQNQTPVAQNNEQNEEPQQTDQQLFRQFLKQSKKSWRWFGTRKDFNRARMLAIISLFILLVVGLITSIVSTICFKMYSTFTFFENAWMVFGIIYLVYAFRTQLTYEVNSLAANSPTKYRTDELGMIFPLREKIVFKIFRWVTIISVLCNIISIWVGMGKVNQVAATITELLFLGAVIFAFFMNLNLFAQYSIIWVEGHNLTTKERVVLVLPPGANELMPEEEFKKKMPFFYE